MAEVVRLLRVSNVVVEAACREGLAIHVELGGCFGATGRLAVSHIATGWLVGVAETADKARLAVDRLLAIEGVDWTDEQAVEPAFVEARIAPYILGLYAEGIFVMT